MALAVVAGAVVGLAPAFAQEDRPVVRAAPAPTGVIVKFRDTVSARGESQTASVDEATADSGASGSRADTMRRVAARARLELSNARALPLGMHVMELDSQNPAESFDEKLERLRADPEIEYAEPDYWRFPLAVPNDPLYANQWYWQNRVDAPSGTDAETAWNTTTGNPGVVIAVLDTGVLFDHPDLGRAGIGGRLLPGYDFITNPNVANDGGGRDADPSDPGDWVDVTDPVRIQFGDCPVSDSSWHGTRVSGLIGARTNNAEGIAGGTWSGWILPVRVLGKCGGFDSDILPGMLWAAGITVANTPPNPHPAKVLNMSLGSSASTCPSSYRDVINQLVARGVLVVASAGNDVGPVSAPGNCPGVLAVTGLRQAGTKVGFSSFGPQVGISAPGGNCVNVSGGPCLYSIDTTWNRGLTTPGTHSYTSQIFASYGTSFSAPIVSAVAGLMLSVNGNLRSQQLIARMQESAKPFPPPPQGLPVCPLLDFDSGQCACTTTTCGAGMLNAAGAVAAALRPIAAIAAPSAVNPGQAVTLSAAGSAAACGRTVTQYAWSIVSGPLGSGGLTNPTGAETQVVAPVIGGDLIVQITVTDDAGRQDSAQITIRNTSTSTTALANAGTTACLPEVLPIGVIVEPQTASAQVGTSVTFTSTVVGVADDTAVTWQVNGIPGGNAALGTITSAGVYTAPAAVPNPAAVTVTAISTADARATGSAVVTVTPPPQPPAPPAPPPSSGGGGGVGLDLFLLLALVPAAARLRRPRFRR